MQRLGEAGTMLYSQRDVQSLAGGQHQPTNGSSPAAHMFKHTPVEEEGLNIKAGKTEDDDAITDGSVCWEGVVCPPEAAAVVNCKRKLASNDKQETKRVQLQQHTDHSTDLSLYSTGNGLAANSTITAAADVAEDIVAGVERSQIQQNSGSPPAEAQAAHDTSMTASVNLRVNTEEDVTWNLEQVAATQAADIKTELCASRLHTVKPLMSTITTAEAPVSSPSKHSCCSCGVEAAPTAQAEAVQLAVLSAESIEALLDSGHDLVNILQPWHAVVTGDNTRIPAAAAAAATAKLQGGQQGANRYTAILTELHGKREFAATAVHTLETYYGPLMGPVHKAYYRKFKVDLEKANHAIGMIGTVAELDSEAADAIEVAKQGRRLLQQHQHYQTQQQGHQSTQGQENKPITNGQTDPIHGPPNQTHGHTGPPHAAMEQHYLWRIQKGHDAICTEHPMNLMSLLLAQQDALEAFVRKSRKARVALKQVGISAEAQSIMSERCADVSKCLKHIEERLDDLRKSQEENLAVTTAEAMTAKAAASLQVAGGTPVAGDVNVRNMPGPLRKPKKVHWKPDDEILQVFVFDKEAKELEWLLRDMSE